MGQHSANVLRGHTRRTFMLMAACIAISACSFAQARKQAADVIITNARVYTVNVKQPWAEAIAIRQHRVAAVGSREKIDHWRGARTKIIDAQGRLVLPGFY